MLTFRGIARASSVDWLDLKCEGEGELNRIDRVTAFTAMHLRVVLTVTSGVDVVKAERLLQKAEQTCLITNSLKCPVKLEARVEGA